jgi:AraC-like DNA-binding protein
MPALDGIPQSAVSIGMMEAGKHDTFTDGYIHSKSAPCTIIAQAVEGRYEVRSQGVRVIAGVGEAFLATSGQALEIHHHAARRGGNMRARWLHVQFLLFTTVDFISLLALPPKLEQRAGWKFGEIIAELLKLQNSPRASALPSLALRNELGFRALRLLCEAAPPSDSGAAFLNHSERLAPVLVFIREHLSEALTIDDLADVARLSRSRFHSYFREHMRVSPMDYVKTVRLNHARQMLITTEQTIYSIAAATGFSNPYHFSREFKLNCGIPPRNFRQQNRGLVV